MGSRAWLGGTCRGGKGPARAALGALAAAASVPLLAGVAQAQPVRGLADPSVNVPRTPAIEAACSAGDGAACQSAAVEAIDLARASEGVGPLRLPAGYDEMNGSQQLLVLADLERTARGLPGFTGLSASLDALAGQGARADNDPAGPAGTQWGSNWAGGEASALLADYDWMYDDGPGSPNLDCSGPSAPGCWDHRRNILADYGPHPSMGAAEVSVGGVSSMAELFSSAAPGNLDYALPAPIGVGATLGPPVPTSVTPELLQIGTTPGVSRSAALTVQAGAAMLRARAAVNGDHGSWKVTPSCTAGPGGHCDLVVTFAPRLPGAAHATVTVHLGRRTDRVGVAAYTGHGYWQATSTGSVVAYAGGALRGSVRGKRLHQPVVGMAATPGGGGYWEVAADGGVFSFGDARFFGSAAALRVHRPVVGMAVAANGRGYWLLSRTGGVYSFGDAHFYGAGRPADGSFASMTAAHGGGGYWLVTTTGRVFAFGSARALGSVPAGAAHAVVGLAPTPDGAGYWVASRSGQVFAFGDARGRVATPSSACDIVGIAAPAGGPGYYLSEADGTVLSAGGAPLAPRVAGTGGGRVVGMATA